MNAFMMARGSICSVNSWWTWSIARWFRRLWLMEFLSQFLSLLKAEKLLSVVADDGAMETRIFPPR